MAVEFLSDSEKKGIKYLIMNKLNRFTEFVWIVVRSESRIKD
jgi:hypothetical protein